MFTNETPSQSRGHASLPIECFEIPITVYGQPTDGILGYRVVYKCAKNCWMFVGGCVEEELKDEEIKKAPHLNGMR